MMLHLRRPPLKKELKVYKDGCVENLFKNKMHCNYRINNQSNVNEMNTNHVYVIIARNQTIYHNCSSNNFTINGNYLIRFEDCNIEIDKVAYKHRNPLTIQILPNSIK